MRCEAAIDGCLFRFILITAGYYQNRNRPMKAIQVKQVGGPGVLELVDLPGPEAKADQVVVKIVASGVNFIDVYYREGRYKAALPFVVGQEGAGDVVAIGP